MVASEYEAPARANARRLLLRIIGRDRHFRLSNLSNPKPSNFGPKSGSFIGLLSSKIFLAAIRYCVTIDTCCSTWGPAVIKFSCLCVFTANTGHLARNQRSFRKLGINSLLNSPQRHIHWTSGYAATSMHNTIFVRIIQSRKIMTISESLVATWRTWEVELHFAFEKCARVLCKAWWTRLTSVLATARFPNRA